MKRTTLFIIIILLAIAIVTPEASGWPLRTPAVLVAYAWHPYMYHKIRSALWFPLFHSALYYVRRSLRKPHNAARNGHSNCRHALHFTSRLSCRGTLRRCRLGLAQRRYCERGTDPMVRRPSGLSVTSQTGSLLHLEAEHGCTHQSDRQYALMKRNTL